MNAIKLIIFPAAGSPTTTLLRLHHSHQFYSNSINPNFIQKDLYKVINTI